MHSFFSQCIGSHKNKNNWQKKWDLYMLEKIYTFWNNMKTIKFYGRKKLCSPASLFYGSVRIIKMAVFSAIKYFFPPSHIFWHFGRKKLCSVYEKREKNHFLNFFHVFDIFCYFCWIKKSTIASHILDE
jgi:hypothetical protein